jgi:hypothetical protein
MTGEGTSRWRVTLSGVSARSMEETVPFGDAFAAFVGEKTARVFPGCDPHAGYYQSGSGMVVSVNVSAADEKSAERAGAEILTCGLPSWITVRGIEARPLLAEPDFTSPPSPS